MKHLITLGFLVAAFIMYELAHGQVADILFCIGGIFELIFWRRVLKFREK
jgi:hypothetical protein